MVAVDAGVVLFATAFATAAVGLLVASIAYRGYRRNASRAMYFLAIGIVFITVTPLLASYGIAAILPLPEALTLLFILCGNILGLLAILYSLERT